MRECRRNPRINHGHAIQLTASVYRSLPGFKRFDVLVAFNDVLKHAATMLHLVRTAGKEFRSKWGTAICRTTQDLSPRAMISLDHPAKEVHSYLRRGRQHRRACRARTCQHETRNEC